MWGILIHRDINVLLCSGFRGYYMCIQYMCTCKMKIYKMINDIYNLSRFICVLIHTHIFKRNIKIQFNN